MAKRKTKSETLPPVVHSFTIDGITYTDGDKLQVITPELGLLPVVLLFAEYSTAMLPTMDFGWVRTPLPCRINKEPDAPNARLKFSCSRMPATSQQAAYHTNTLLLIYFCSCAERIHTSSLVWREVSFELGVIRAAKPGVDKNNAYRPNNHPLVAGWQQLQPVPFEELKREPIATDTHGQFTLFDS